MISDQTRNDIWQELLDVARLVRYYEALCNQYQRRHSFLRISLLFAATGEIGALLAVLSTTIQLTIGVIIALLVAWDLVSNYAKKAAVLHTISIECSELENKWRELWADINNAQVGEAEAQRKNKELAQKLLDVTERAGVADIQENRKLNEKCEKAAFQVVVDRYTA